MFLPRGLSGIDNLVKAEIKELHALRSMKISEEWMVKNIKSLDAVSKLRIPQSAWIPLIEGTPVRNCDDIERYLGEFTQWDALPKLISHGPRVSTSADSTLAKRGYEILKTLKSITEEMKLGTTELSLKIDHEDRMFLSVNAIPPRPWLDSPIDLTVAEKSVDWWSLDPSENSRPSEPSESAIKLFRNEFSLACLCAAFVRTSPLRSMLQTRSELLLWDPFANNGVLLMEILQTILNATISEPRQVTIIGNVKSRDGLAVCEQRLEKWRASNGLTWDDDLSSEQTTSRTTGRKSRRKSAEDDEDETEVSGLVSKSVQLGSCKVAIHITSRPFQETLPFISGGVILSHIPKTYNELTGIDKYQLTEWTAFGNLLKSSEIEGGMFFSETGSFQKYSKLKTIKVAHLVSPNGRSVGNFSRWVPFNQ